MVASITPLSTSTILENAPLHPYYPLNLPISAYVANEWPMHTTLAVFGSMVVLLFGLTMGVLGRVAPAMGRGERGTVWWFVLCGFLHCCFEGYFVLSHASLAGSQHPFAQLWKEYALSDSRYLISDPLVLIMEGLTAVIWGPLCFLAAVLVVKKSAYRHPVQMMVCVGHVYGLALYYGTSLWERYMLDRSWSRPEVLYFWGYYLGLNALWFVVPVVLLVSSLRTMKRAVVALEKVENALARNSMSARPRTPVGKGGSPRTPLGEAYRKIN